MKGTLNILRNEILCAERHDSWDKNIQELSLQWAHKNEIIIDLLNWF